MKTILIILMALPIFLSCNAQQKDANEFEKGLIRDSATLLDVRTTGEYQGAHINNALHADWLNKPEFERRISFINKEKPLYVYCLSGGRSAAAASFLRNKGFKNVVDLKGGINGWKLAGKPIIEAASNNAEMDLSAFNKSIVNNTVLVDVGATWCPPCVQMQPIIKKLSNTFGKDFTLVNVDGGNDKTILAELKVEQLPVFIVYKNGKQVWRKDGIATEAELKAALDLK